MAAEGASPPVSSEELNSSDTEAGTEAAVAPYMARLSPSPTLRPLQAADEPLAPGAAAAGAPSRAAPLSAPDDDQPPSPVTRAVARQRHQRQQQQQEQQQQQQQQEQMQEALQRRRQEEAALEQQETPQRPEQQAGEPVAASPDQPPADQAAAATAAEIRDITSGLDSPPAKAKGPLVPWSKAQATAAERQIYDSGAMSAATLRFVSPQREAEFGAAHAALLTRWVRTFLQCLLITQQLLPEAGTTFACLSCQSLPSCMNNKQGHQTSDRVHCKLLGCICCQHSETFASGPLLRCPFSVTSQVDTGAMLLAVLYLVLQLAAPQLFVGAAAGPLLLPAAATAAAALLRSVDPAR